MPAFGPLLVASVTASVITHQLLGYQPTYSMPIFAPIAGIDILPFAGLGLVIGACAPLFLVALDFGRRAFDRLALPLPMKLALGGLVVGVLSVQVPQVWGNGYSVVDSILNNDWTWHSLMLVLVFKVLATTATVGSGAVGGVFTPTLFCGAAVGALYALGLEAAAPESMAVSAAAAVGMGAMLAATTHAPLMAIIMISEMTVSYQLVLPLMLACVAAYTVARLFRTESMYSASLRRQRADAPKRPFSELRVRDLLKPDRPSIAPDMALRAVAEAFAAIRVQYLYVTDAGGRFLGAVSLHDLTRRMAAGDSAQTASDILLPDFPRLNAEMDLGEALGIFAKHHGERLPVVARSKGSKLLGSATKTDLLFLMQDGLND
jgi:CIC family chloride channel protein